MESSATCGFAYGLLKGVHMGLLDGAYEAVAFKALEQFWLWTGGICNRSPGTPMGREDKNFYKEIP